MSRERKNWFSFGGRSSFEFGIKMVSVPQIPTPKVKGTAVNLDSRHGDHWHTDGKYETISIKITFDYSDRSMNTDRQIRQWLRGSGRLAFSRLPDLEWDARIVDEISVAYSAGRWRAVAAFVLQPLAHVILDQKALDYTESPMYIFNAYNVESYPRITLRGTGSFVLTLGDQSLQVLSLTDGIIIDSERQDAFSLDETTLMNTHVSGELFVIPPGRSSFTCAASNETSKLASITIEPNWRSL